MDRILLAVLLAVAVGALSGCTFISADQPSGSTAEPETGTHQKTFVTTDFRIRATEDLSLRVLGYDTSNNGNVSVYNESLQLGAGEEVNVGSELPRSTDTVALQFNGSQAWSHHIQRCNTLEVTVSADGTVERTMYGGGDCTPIEALSGYHRHAHVIYLRPEAPSQSNRAAGSNHLNHMAAVHNCLQCGYESLGGSYLSV